MRTEPTAGEDRGAARPEDRSERGGEPLGQYRPIGAWGHGWATRTAGGLILDVWYPPGQLGLGDPPAIRMPPPGPTPRSGSLDLCWAEVTCTIASLAAPPLDTADAYLRLHLLSHRQIQPRQSNMDGIYRLLSNVAWTSAGPCLPEDVPRLRWAERAAGRHLTVYTVDKFPRMTDYVVPSRVRIADADRVRLGAHLAPGTTVLHEGLVNFNAGTLGRSMIEGRVSTGVIVGEGSDVGGGASIMGTLSGGGRHVVTIGRRCLLGANSGVGISLGDDCVVEAGCYITAGSKLTMPDGRVVKGAELSGASNLRFWRNSISGSLEASPRTGPGIALNDALHVA